jgi:glycosyltransferase involved in cell wall biosynthesis
VAYFAERGHDVHVASCERPDELAATFHPLPAPPLPRALRYPLAAPALRALVARLAPAAINAHFVPNYGFMTALAGGHPHALSVWGSDVLLSAAHSPLHRWRARFALSRADLVFTDADMLTDAVVALGVPRARTLMVPLGVDTRVFASASASRGADGLPRVVSTRRLEPVYDIPTLLAGARAAAASTAFALDVAGDGSLREALVLAGSDLPRTSFHGALREDEIARLLQRADVYVSTSLSDSTSVSLLEAMACGAFPVVSDLPANREWIEHGVNGLLFPPGDAPRLAACLIDALADGARRADAATRNQAIVRARATRDACFGRIENALVALAESGGRR